MAGKKIIRKTDGSKTVIATGAGAKGIVGNLPSDTVRTGPQTRLAAPAQAVQETTKRSQPIWATAAAKLASENDLKAAQDAYLETQEAYERARAASNEINSRTSPIVQQWYDYLAVQEGSRRDLTAQIKTNADQVYENAKRIYIEAGVNARLASMLAHDMRDNILGAGRFVPEEKQGVCAPVRFKVKRTGGDELVTQTEAAALAAKTDTNYQEAAELVNKDVALLSQLSRRTPEVEQMRQAHVAALEERLAAYRISTKAQQANEGAYKRLVEAQARHRAGVPPTAVLSRLDTLSVRKAPEISRNPDGTTNIWVRQEADANHPNHWYDPVVAVETSDARDLLVAPNILVTESGQRVYRVEHWFRGPGKGWNLEPIVCISEPADGATPLVNEGNPERGWFASIDTTD